VNFERVLQKVLWRLVTEGSVSYRRIKRSFGLDDDALEDVRRVLIGALHIATDLDGEFLASIDEIARRLRRDKVEIRDKVAEVGRACR